MAASGSYSVKVLVSTGNFESLESFSTDGVILN